MTSTMNRAALIALIPLLVAVGFAGPIGRTAGQAVNTVTEIACKPSDLPIARVCFQVSVPLDRESDSSKQVTIEGTILQSTSDRPLPDPVLFLPGGPGESGAADLELLANSPIIADRDIIVVSPRGTGGSVPRLDCPEVNEARQVALSAAGSPRVETRRFADAVGRCANRLRAEGIDLDAYHTPAIAGDLEAVRTALEIDRWNLYGVSYGTRAALELMRQHPEPIRSVVLDSAYPPDDDSVDPSRALTIVQRGVGHLFSACAADAECGEAFPDLPARFNQMVKRFDATPYATTTVIPSTGEEVEVSVTGADLATFVWNAIKREELIPVVPALIVALAAGETSVIDAAIAPALGDAIVDDPAMFSYGAQMSVECVDGADAITDLSLDEIVDDASVFSTAVLFSSGAFCGAWGTMPGSAEFSTAVGSDVPTLLVTGAFDPIALPEITARTGESLTQSIVAEFPASGHAPTLSSSCAMKGAAAFLNDRILEAPACLASVPPVAFLTILEG